MDQHSEIVRLDHGHFLVPSKIPGEAGTYKSGEFLTMKDGSVWFHPDDGGKPIQAKPPFKT